MEQICLKGSDMYSVTPLSNYFIDEIMPDANGEFVKVYLYLLRVLSSSNSNISICHIADKLNHTEKDVIRALKYWEQAKLLQLHKDSSNRLTSIQLLDVSHIKQTDAPEPVPKAAPADTVDTAESLPSSQQKRHYSTRDITRFKENPDIVQLLYVAERYIGHPLKQSESNTLLYIYDQLHMPVEVIEYLLEYCISNNHSSSHYIEQTAINWVKDGIDTVEKAKTSTILYSKTCYPILKALGITKRDPVKSEQDLIVKWTNEYGFSTDIILEACRRTMNSNKQPPFPYTDGILTNWYKLGVRTKSDIAPLDKEHREHQAQRMAKTAASNQTAAKASSGSTNKFNNFRQRSYNYEELEKELLSAQIEASFAGSGISSDNMP